MAAIRRAFVPQLSVHSFTRSILESSRHHLNARYASKTSSLQPVFPEKQDEILFEDPGNEYTSIGTDFRLFHKANVKTHPCDALEAAAVERNEPLASALLKEYREAGIEILFRPEYEELANLSLEQLNFDAFLGWLSLVPPVGGENGVLFPKNTNMVEQMSQIRLPFDQMYRLLYLFGRKGWSGPVPSKLVATLAKYTGVVEFTRFLEEVLGLHQAAHGSSEEVRWIHAEWRNRAVQEFSKRNDPETAFHILAQSPKDVVEFDHKAVDLLYSAVRRARYPIPAFAVDIFQKVQRLPTQSPVRNGDVTKQAYQVLFHRTDRTSPKAYQRSWRQTAILIGKLKHLLIAHESRSTIDPKAVAFFFYSLLYSPYHNITPSPHLLQLFRRRIARLGSESARVLWATIEVEILLYLGDPHAAMLYYHKAFLPLDIPSFLRGNPNEHWELWMNKEPTNSLPPVPTMPLRPSAPSIMAIWRAAIELSTRDPNVTPTGNTTLYYENAYLSQSNHSSSSANGAVAVKFDTAHLTTLFQNFLSIFDTESQKQRTFFSNPFTRVRYFEMFLRRYVTFAPDMCAWVMAQIQARDVPLDHRIWAIYAKSKIDAGDPGFLLKVFELLQNDIGTPLDFSPAALKDWSTAGVRGGTPGGTGHQFTLPAKVLNAYIYGLRQLIYTRAFKEALELHSRIIRAGYQEGTSIALDRLIYRMLEELRLVMRHGPRLRVRKDGVDTEEMAFEEKFDIDRDDID